MNHCEIPKPHEKLNGYDPPTRPMTADELAAAVREGQIVWKVDRASVNWTKPTKTRLLDLGIVRMRCAIIGSVGYGNGVGSWYFVRILGWESHPDDMGGKRIPWPKINERL